MCQACAKMPRLGALRGFNRKTARQMPRQATVEILTDALIAEFRPAAMKKLSLNCQLQLSRSLLNTLVDRLAFADERIAHA